MNVSLEELLKYAIENDKIDLELIQQEMEMRTRKEYLKKHTWAISQHSDGFFRTYIPDEEKGRKLIKKRTLEEVENVVVAYYKNIEENPTIREVFEEWLDRKMNLKKISLSTYTRYKQFFDRHYAEFGKRRIKNISSVDIEEFLEEQIPKYDLTVKAFSGLKTVTRGFLKRAKKLGYIKFNVEEIFYDMDISEKEFKKVIKEDYQEVFDENEMPKMIAYLKDNPDVINLGILIMFLTGVRVGELVTLKYDDVDFERNTIKVRRTETRYKENGKYVYSVKEFPKSEAGVRTAIIPKDYSWVLKQLKMINPLSEYIISRTETGERYTTHAIRGRMRRICARLDIYNKSPHKARKTYGSILLDNYVDKKMITDLMGHADILVTEQHYHRNRKSIERKMEIVSNIPEFNIPVAEEQNGLTTKTIF